MRYVTSGPLCPTCSRPVEPRFASQVGDDWYHGAHLPLPEAVKAADAARATPRAA